MFGAEAQHELLRLAIPRRVYTQSHIDYVVEAILEVSERKEKIRGLASYHTQPEDIGRVAQAAAPGKLVITHMMPGSVPAELETAARRHFSGSVTVGEDLLEV